MLGRFVITQVDQSSSVNTTEETHCAPITNVLNAYYEHCCVCKYDIRMNGASVALEAAHIRMHSAGGPDEVNNGLSLCVMHHKLFDFGAITVDNDLKVRVSERVGGDWGRKLNDEFHQREISLP